MDRLYPTRLRCRSDRAGWEQPSGIFLWPDPQTGDPRDPRRIKKGVIQMFFGLLLRGSHRALLPLVTLAVLFLGVWSARPLEAQDISYTTVSKVEFGGSMGTMAINCENGEFGKALQKLTCAVRLAPQLASCPWDTGGTLALNLGQQAPIVSIKTARCKAPSFGRLPCCEVLKDVVVYCCK